MVATDRVRRLYNAIMNDYGRESCVITREREDGKRVETLELFDCAYQSSEG